MIDIDGESRTHVQERHVEGMQLEKYRDKSYFFAWVAWEPLVMATEVFPAVKSPDNPDNCFRLAKAQVDIGVNDPLGANMTTPQFSVFTDADSGHLETAHPGLPRKHPWGDA
jgi:hypothetical protein